MKPKTDKERRNKGNNKTRILRIRCSEEEQRKIQKRAEQSGKKLSEFSREMLLTGEVIAIPKLEANEQEAVRILQRISHFFTHISNLIKTKDASWAVMTKNLSLVSLEAFKRFYNPRHRVVDEVYDILKIERNDR
ncbi:hypothetical protein PORCRE_1482 [Porphyromonas crevioricanis JCM 15906]|uniref:Uncharacterized protein n=1 Tax=Porphyromonas crevioricanis JCM 15906 TaxID=1305617 RepID=T1DTF2_9PORP|nr:hypothetical protein [Porphyromonas crevioricanis]GAD05774.1 hypothetical protein PORCRE_1482 [Porphyromonas crevioricanis JCM 15906]SJZ62627.1 hypothetical protein SAMN02745203_00377 [Porphyromonas crevioricanis]